VLSEFNIRAEINAIEALDATPVHRTKAFLRLAKRVVSAAGRLTTLSRHYYREGDPLRGARFREAAQRLCDVHDDLRARATVALRSVPTPLGYGYAPRADAVPHWEATA
jgi:hypothetical protein